MPKFAARMPMLIGYQFIFLIFLYTGILAAAPENDQFSNAAALLTSVEVRGTTLEASVEVNEPKPPGRSSNSTRSVWYSWTAPATGWYRLETTCNFTSSYAVWSRNNLATVLSVHANSVFSFGDKFTKSIALYFPAVSGINYHIAVGNEVYNALPESQSHERAGNFILKVEPSAAPPASIQELTLSPSTIDITGAPGEVQINCRTVTAAPVRAVIIEWARQDDGYARSVLKLTSGNEFDGTYGGTLSLPRYFSSGNYHITSIKPIGASFISEYGEIPFPADFPRSITVLNSGPQDITPPEMRSISISSSTVDLSAGSKTITAELRITDDFSGLADVAPDGWDAAYLTMIPVGSNPDFGFNRAKITSIQRTAGSPQDGIYSVSLALNSQLQGGVYTLVINGLQDKSLNRRSAPYQSDQSSFPGPFKGSIEVIRPPDHLLNSFSISPSGVEISAAPSTVQVTFRITSSGTRIFGSADLELFDPDKKPIVSESIKPASRISGNGSSGTYSKTIAIPRFLKPGTYTARLAIFGEAPGFIGFGSSTNYGGTGLAMPAASVNQIEVTNHGVIDATGPELTFLSVSPPSPIANTGSSIITIDTRVTDPGYGVKSLILSLQLGPVNNITGVTYPLGAATRISGTAADGTWRYSGAIPSTIPADNYHFNYLATDEGGNTSASPAPFNTLPPTVEITGASAYEVWAKSRNLVGADAIASADPDKDSVVNLMEFAMGMDPLDKKVAGLPVLQVIGNEASTKLRLNFSYPAEPASMHLTYIVQFSNDGIQWTDQPDSSFYINRNSSFRESLTTGFFHPATCADPIPYNRSKPRYARLKVVPSS